ncbi:MAG: hypothetical protein FIB01_15220 [Gemmatimonadetes bacterium]|nr:hypothetical protein [Gemmatimonadota bacterium]
MIEHIIGRARAVPARAALVLVASALAVLSAACSGDNLFEGRQSGGGGPPRITALIVPLQAAENARVDARVKAIGGAGIAKINVRFRGAATDDQEFTIATVTRDTVTVDASIDLPVIAEDSVLRVEAYATDAAGAVSDIATATIRIVDASAPTVTATAGAAKVSIGRVLELRVTANDPFGLQKIGYAFVNAAKDTVLKALATVGGTSRDTLFRIQLPTTLKPADLSVLGVAVNAANLRGVSAPLALTVTDELGPEVQILEPVEGESYPLTDSIRVRVRARDATGVSKIALRGVSFRYFPDSTRNSYPVLRYPEFPVPLPLGPHRPAITDTTVVRYLKPLPDSISEPVYFIAAVTDAAGNVGVDTTRVIPGPRVAILNPPSGTTARINSSIPVRIYANDPGAGLDSLKLYVQGVKADSFVFRQLQGTRDPLEKTVLLNVGGVAGNLSLQAFVWNTLGVRGSMSAPVAITVSTVASGAPPKVRRTFEAADRVEMGDSIRIHVTGTDVGGGGIIRLGAVVIAIPAGEDATLARDTFYFSTPPFSPARGGTPDTVFVLQLRETYNELSTTKFPLGFTFQVHAFAVDSQTRCGAAVQEADQDLTCQVVNGAYFMAQGQTGRTYTASAVIGTSRSLPARSVIADALPDTANRRLYLSNYSNNQVNVLQFSDTSFRTIPLPVGSHPWGLFLKPGPDKAPESLMIANSGGTSLSFVPTAVPTAQLREDPSRRILTPNEVLIDLKEEVKNGYLRYSGLLHEFSDRPQFVAVDKNGNILYSTTPTRSAIEGTVRSANRPEGGIYEPRILIPGRQAAVKDASDTWAIAHVDSVVIVPSVTGDDNVIIYDHVPGFPDQKFQSAPGYAGAAILDVMGKGSDIFAARGTWNRPGVGFSDTTYVAYSKDLSTIAFGEGALAPYGRILLWSANDDDNYGRVSSTGTYDLIGNAAEQVTGLALNVNGLLGVARGLATTYFFTNNVQREGELRLNGLYAGGAQAGTGGVALHPNHVDGSAGSNDSTLAFIATADRTIKIVDTFHYLERGEIFIRDRIVGQLRASPPMGSVNASIPSTSCNYTVAQLFGVTSANNVVILNVRKRDIKDLTTGVPNCSN